VGMRRALNLNTTVGIKNDNKKTVQARFTSADVRGNRVIRCRRYLFTVAKRIVWKKKNLKKVGNNTNTAIVRDNLILLLLSNT